MKKGQYFSAFIKGKKVEGRIQYENDRYYLCQNSNDGSDCADKLGFKYSWAVSSGDEYHLKYNDVTNFKIISKVTFDKLNPDFKPIKKYPKTLGYEITLKDKKIAFGCGAVTITPFQLERFIKIFSNKKDVELIRYFVGNIGGVPNEHHLKALKTLLKSVKSK